jgi:predicted short-subunit dehydrogenase-like oxidoreductase (DUF2520 family)
VAVLGREARPLPAPLGPATEAWAPALAAADLVLLAVPDDAVAGVALRLRDSGALLATQVVLHTSGRLDRTELAALEPTGASLGSFHPLQTLRAAEGSPDALVGSPAVIEGDPRALEAARDLAARLRMSPVVEVAGEAKPRYHAAAVFASNYLVVLADVAGRLARGAGIEAPTDLFIPLMRRTLAHLEAGDPAAALTGPIRRGDVGTVQAHLDGLDPATRALYAMLGREALTLAERAGLDRAKVDALRGLLE